jgi:mRNA interferase MazF
MTDYEFGDVVLVPFPFTDQSASKKRPAVLIIIDSAPTSLSWRLPAG